LQGWLAPAVFTVTTTAGSGAGSLRQAIVDVNNHPGPNTIQFAIASSGVQTIQPTSTLPRISEPLTIDRTTEPGYSGRSIFVRDGTNAGQADGLDISTAFCTVKGLAIVHPATARSTDLAL
jgi:hypothetical protein